VGRPDGGRMAAQRPHAPPGRPSPSARSRTLVLVVDDEITPRWTLVEELVNFEVKLSASGHDSYGEAQESVHDNLVVALAVALWVAARHQSADPGQFLTLRY
jgi:hypothetical protein